MDIGKIKSGKRKMRHARGHDKVIRETYRKFAAKYDETRFTHIQGIIRDKMEKKALSHALREVQKDSKILEVGCGTGRFLEFLENSGYTNLYGVDQAEEMLEVADKKCHATLQIGNAYVLPFKDNSFDVVFAFRVLSHLEKPENAINEMLRVGDIIIFDLLNRYSLSYVVADLNNKYKKLHGKEVDELGPVAFKKISDIENKFKDKVEIIPLHYLPIDVPLPYVYFRFYETLNGIVSKIHPKKFVPSVFVKIINGERSVK